MNFVKSLLRPVMLSALLTLGGCAYLQPLISDLNFISIDEEKTLGKQLDAEIQKQMTLVTGNDTERVRAIGKKLADQLPAPKSFDYTFAVVKDDTPNAFTIPGGFIYVHTGLFKIASSDSEVAGVIAHEIGHAYERHPTKSISRAYGTQYLTDLIFGKEKAKAKQLALVLTQGGLLTRYGREDETEADLLGYQLLKKAGMNPNGLTSFLKKLQSMERGSPLPFLSSHPPTQERVARLESLTSVSQ